MSALTQPSSQPERKPDMQPVPVAPQPPEKEPSRGWIWLLLLVIVAGGGVAWMTLRPNAQEKAPVIPAAQLAQVKMGKLVKSIRAGGQTAAIDFANISAPEVHARGLDRSLTIIKLAPAGATVKKGDVIAEFDATVLQDSLDDQRALVEVAEANLAKKVADLKVEWETFEQTLLVAKATRDKANLDLKTSEVKSEIEAELLRLASEEAEARYKQLQKDSSVKRQSQAADIELLRLEVRDQQQNLVDLQNDLNRFTIHSPRNGLVVLQSNFNGGEMRQVSEGEQVRPGRSFMKVVDPSRMVVDATVNQTESENFTFGQDANIGLDAFPDLKLTGAVTGLGALATGGWRENYYIRNIPIRVTIDHADARVIPDLSAYADVEVRSKEHGLLVPRAALNYEGEKAFVMRSVGGKLQKVPVTIELTNATLAAVSGGLQEGDQVVLNAALLSSR
ncbi:MAG: efflux RND transporter periplasmic adaptor subunit [Bryobacterales bacterium]|nr:efflux RND transporter periplasmic adaptor subunit [Bryobacterales bacterium]